MVKGSNEKGDVNRMASKRFGGKRSAAGEEKSLFLPLRQGG